MYIIKQLFYSLSSYMSDSSYTTRVRRVTVKYYTTCDARSGPESRVVKLKNTGSNRSLNERKITVLYRTYVYFFQTCERLNVY